MRKLAFELKSSCLGLRSKLLFKSMPNRGRRGVVRPRCKNAFRHGRAQPRKEHPILATPLKILRI
uniref:Uncharacterized protein n=1 Tax=Cannabis sativa TaxID=3483 RepID=A0A803R592_CANSA